ncbi:DUF2989 domain-containing protein [Motilimonas pumila]|nr:DUF2989 domain-containing protein [Motilimonas pumila]
MVNTFKFAVLLGATLLATGCFNKTTTKAICEKSPELCQGLNTDGWCKAERREVILKRQNYANESSELNQYYILRSFIDYKQCIEIASNVEPIHAKHKKTERVEGFITAVNEIERIDKATQHSELPQLAYYHWLVNGDLEAKERFLAIEGTSAENDPELTLALATYYFERDSEKTIRLLYKTLRLQKDTLPNPSIYNSLTTLYLKTKNYQAAYIWMQVAHRLGEYPINESWIDRQHKFSPEEKDKLQEMAGEVIDDIKNFQFQSGDYNM